MAPPAIRFRGRALVVVLGELSRSPRMQYQCLALADLGFQVTVIATGSIDEPCQSLQHNKHIKQSLLPPCIEFKNYLPSPLAYILKPIWQAILLIYYLFLVSIPNVVLVQNPPSIPTLPILYLYKKIVRSKLIIDWHNYGYSILGLSLGPEHIFVKFSKAIEIFFGRLADAGLCVTEAMRVDLRNTYKIKYPIRVLYDRPPKCFKPLSALEKHNFYQKLQNNISAFRPRDEKTCEEPETRFSDTRINGILKPKRPAIIISSTSWTEDEDFSILIDALRLYDAKKSSKQTKGESNDDLPDLVCVITGKGPLKSHYESLINACKFKHIEFVLPWLSHEDYTKMVGSSDLGISLHLSSSGIDLPMKVVDMFGCGIPVLAFYYETINELVKNDINGLTFKDPEDLFKKLTLLLARFSVDLNTAKKDGTESKLVIYKDNIIGSDWGNWESNWLMEAKPIFDLISPFNSR